MALESEFALWAKDKTTEEVIAKFKDQLLLILVDLLGGDVMLQIEEVDNIPKGKILTMENATPEKPFFRLVVGRKQ